MTDALPAYAELHCLSNFTFQRGASSPEELVERAIRLGYHALALTDECSVSGLVRAHAQVKLRAKEGGHLQLLPGAEFRLGPADAPGPAPRLVVLPHDLQGWGNLCECITAARARASKGSYLLDWEHLEAAPLARCEVLLVLPRAWDVDALQACCLRAQALFGEHLWLALTLWRALDDGLWRDSVQQVAERTGLRVVAAGNVHMHARARKPLHDVITAVGLGRSIADCGFELQPNAEAHLRRRVDLGRVYPKPAMQATLEVAARCRFSLDALKQNYPRESLLPGHTPAQTLRHHTEAGLHRRYPQGVPPEVRKQVAHELALIAEKGYEMYFLTVHHIVQFARSEGILCQGRGSAANSVVCFCLEITEIDPKRTRLLFERFISRERNEPPDIDVDFEHERREEVIQYIYRTYGRERAAITAVVTSYGRKSAIRDVGKALGFDDDTIDAFAREQRWFDERIVLAPELAERLEQVGIDKEDLRIHQWLELTRELLNFPRHLSQHVGGFVLTQDKLTRLVPVEPATMEGRSVIQWEKDDLDEVGLMKVDVLALGMLTALRRCRDFVRQWRGRPDFGIDAVSIPEDDEPTYDMLCQADTVGVFQIESRAQMSMLPRLKPRTYYDLVVEVAIVRPGPIQGGMVHPYLQRREARLRNETWEWEHDPRLAEALGRTLGVPIFQEQVMQIAILAADFTPDEADDLRRSMAAWKRKGGVHKFHDRLVGRMVHNGYPQEYAERIFDQMKGFGEYGFPESHAASFALLVYFSSWLKRHEPACFLAALLNAQPLGFYSPSQLVQDARRHGVEVRPVDVVHSDWGSTLEPVQGSPDPAVRIGLRQVQGFGDDAGRRLVDARALAPFTDAEDLALRAGLDRSHMQALAAADALRSLAGHRRQQLWQAAALRTPPALLRRAPVQEDLLALPPAPLGAEVEADYNATGLTLRTHPVGLLRPQLLPWRVQSAAELRELPHGQPVRACGIVVTRQQPATAKGVIFVTLEDETGSVNVVVWKSLREKQRAELLHSRLLAVYGTWQRDVDSGGLVCHVLARRLRDLTPLLGGLATHSRDFH